MTHRAAVSARRTSTRASAVLACAVLALGLSACGDGDSSGGSDDSGSRSRAGQASAEEAYAAYAQAVRDDDVDAFRDVISDGFWSDLSPERTDTADYVHDQHWALEHDLLVLPDEPTKVLGAREVGLTDDQISGVGTQAGIDGLGADDLAVIVIEDAHVGVPEDCYDEPDAEECSPSDEARADASDVNLVVLRDGSTWRVAGMEPAA
ncbi:hypothetical protein [Nocardioides sp. Root140]|uniref:hypothetical protein n=1 Tax=Nocardioides sp. Root140 TaxID=1736460 RepID=UPI0012E3BBF9|nr:hypothetical protein [Nocardioides sp. Root140]